MARAARFWAQFARITDVEAITLMVLVAPTGTTVTIADAETAAVHRQTTATTEADLVLFANSTVAEFTRRNTPTTDTRVP